MRTHAPNSPEPLNHFTSPAELQTTAQGILGNSRRQHYGHAALLVASCVAYAPKKRAAELLKWAMDVRQLYWRRHAFREELAGACQSLGVLLPG